MAQRGEVRDLYYDWSVTDGIMNKQTETKSAQIGSSERELHDPQLWKDICKGCFLLYSSVLQFRRVETINDKCSKMFYSQLKS